MLFFRITSFCAIPTTNACNRPQYVSKAEKNEFLAAEYNRAFRRCPSLRRFVKRSQLREAIRSGHFCALKRKHAYHARVSVRFQSKERGMRVKDREKNGRSFHFSRGPNRKSRYTSFLGCSLLRNHTETFTSQASFKAITVSELYKHFLTPQDEKRAAFCEVASAERTRESTSETDFF